MLHPSYNYFTTERICAPLCQQVPYCTLSRRFLWASSGKIRKMAKQFDRFSYRPVAEKRILKKLHIGKKRKIPNVLLYQKRLLPKVQLRKIRKIRKCLVPKPWSIKGFRGWAKLNTTSHRYDTLFRFFPLPALCRRKKDSHSRCGQGTPSVWAQTWAPCLLNRILP